MKAGGTSFGKRGNEGQCEPRTGWGFRPGATTSPPWGHRAIAPPPHLAITRCESEQALKFRSSPRSRQFLLRGNSLGLPPGLKSPGGAVGLQLNHLGGAGGGEGGQSEGKCVEAPPLQDKQGGWGS